MPESGSVGIGSGRADARAAELEAENARLRAALAEQEQLVDQLRSARQIDGQIRLVADALPVLVAYVDADQRYRYNNKAYEHWLGRPRRELYGRRLDEVFGGETYEIFRPLVEAALSGERVSAERSVPNGEGKLRHVQLDYVPARTEDGAVLGFYSLVRDVSDSKRVEQALRQSEQQQRAIIDATPECVKIVAPDGTLVQMNAVGLAMIEADSAEAVVGRCIFDVVAPEDRAEWRARHARVCAGESLSWEFGIVGLRGTRRRLETHAVPLPLPDGRSAQLAVTRDITARQEAEEALRESEARFRAMADCAPAPVWVTGAGGIEFVNKAFVEVAGVPPEQLTGDTWTRLIHPEDLPPVLEARARAWAQSRGFSYDARFR
ncbi:MAG: PAS domain-containing protein, partial [Pseudomonadota bacterium]|nr:PAS domain-containing protein [Pseudomonadota bacterium]